MLEETVENVADKLGIFVNNSTNGFCVFDGCSVNSDQHTCVSNGCNYGVCGYIHENAGRLISIFQGEFTP